MTSTRTDDNTMISGRLPGRWIRGSGLAGILCLAFAMPAFAGAPERAQAKRIHDRLAGVPPTDLVLDAMEAEINADAINGPVAAAHIALQNPAFYNVTLKNFATPWTNRDQSVFAPLNDYTATVIGMIRDRDDAGNGLPFTEILSADILYVGDDSDPNIAAHSRADNQHYIDLEREGVDLSNPANLFDVQQSTFMQIPNTATAGVMTSRAASEAFFIDGTNRAMFRFTLMNHMCNDLEQVKDTTGIPDRIRQDVSRSPGGDSRLFLNGCVGCHIGMDPLAQAFAYYDFDETIGELVYTDGQVQPKYLINEDNFKYGYVTPNDRWDNYWRTGPNAILGWGPGSGSGNGARSLGQELAGSEAFARCQVTKVFRTVCLGEPSQTQMMNLKTIFQSGYNMKNVFASAAAECS